MAAPHSRSSFPGVPLGRQQRPAHPYYDFSRCATVCPMPAPAARAVPRRLTARPVASAGALHAAAGVHTPGHFALQVRVAAGSPRAAWGPRGARRVREQQPHQDQPQAAGHGQRPARRQLSPPRASAALPSCGWGRGARAGQWGGSWAGILGAGPSRTRSCFRAGLSVLRCWDRERVGLQGLRGRAYARGGPQGHGGRRGDGQR